MRPQQAFRFLAVGALLAGGFAWAFRQPPAPVDLAEIGRGDIVVAVVDEGVARIHDVFTISAPVHGRVLRTPLHVGDAVLRDETVVAVIQPQAPELLDARLREEAEAAERAAAASMALAEAELQRAEAEELYWRAELERNERLARTNTIAERTLEQTRLQLAIRQAAVATALAGIEVRRHELRRARAALIEPDIEAGERPGECCLSLRSPVSGQVLEIIAKNEQVVGTGAALLSVGDRSDLEIVVDLLSADAVRVSVGATARILRWGGDNTLEGRVNRIEPTGFTKVSALGIDEQRVNVILEIVSPPEAWSGLGHEYRVLAEIVVLERGDVLRIPLGALFRERDDWAAFAVIDGRAELRRLSLGARNGEFAEVLSGLEEGENVVLHPGDRVVDGVRVELRDPA